MEQNNQNTLEDIKLIVVFDAPIQKVWDAVSTSEGIADWFMPNNFKSEIGYEFQLQTPFGASPCKVLEIDEPHRLAFSWDEDGWIISFHLKELDGKTEFTLIHGGWKNPDEILPKANEKSSVIRDRMEQGWIGINERLRKVVEN